MLSAKIIGTGLVARIFLLTKPALMQIAWLRNAYERFVPWQEALFARVRASWVWRYGSVMRSRANSTCGGLDNALAAARGVVASAP